MGFVNENIALTLPALTVESGDITGSLVLPALVVTAVGASASGAVTLPAFVVVSTGTQGAVTSAELILPELSLSADALVGVMGSATLSLPSLISAGTATQETFANLVLPALTAAAQGGIELGWTGALDLPMLQLTAAMITDSTGDITVTTDYVTWTVNEQTAQHSKYTNWLVNSYAEIGSAQFVSTPTGIFELIGDDDAGTNIDARVYWPPTSFGTTKQKRCEQAFLRIRARGDVRLVALTDETERRIYNQDMTGFPANLHPKRVQFTRKLQGALWQMGFENIDGADFDLHDIEVDIVVLTRRLK